jgi:hypothetical protein
MILLTKWYASKSINRFVIISWKPYTTNVSLTFLELKKYRTTIKNKDNEVDTVDS